MLLFIKIFTYMNLIVHIGQRLFDLGTISFYEHGLLNTKILYFDSNKICI